MDQRNWGRRATDIDDLGDREAWYEYVMVALLFLLSCLAIYAVVVQAGVRSDIQEIKREVDTLEEYHEDLAADLARRSSQTTSTTIMLGAGLTCTVDGYEVRTSPGAVPSSQPEEVVCEELP